MPAPYGLDCPIATTLDIIGERWTILVVRDLFLEGPRRYQDLQESLGGISPNTLSERLKKLESAGIVTRETYQETPLRTRYVLTPKGRSLGPILRELRKWGALHSGAGDE
ncbi:MAG: helix-turn-helix domain-containing protein [Pseudomonadota bacterium]